MIGFRPKLTLAFGGVLAILLIVSCFSLWILNSYSRALDRFLFENYRSVGYAQGMRDAIEDMDYAAVLSIYGDAVLAGRARDAAAAKFESNLKDEFNNLTLAGEADAARELQNRFRVYLDAHAKVFDASRSIAEREAVLRGGLEDSGRLVKEQTQVITRMNLENMVRGDGEIKTTAANTRTAMIVLLIAGLGMAVAFIAVVSRSLLRPLRSLTKSAREIERGNLDLMVKVRGHDEVGQLAEAFNAMAVKLREFRRSDRAQILRTQQTTQLAVDSLPDAVTLISINGQIEVANHSARRLFGLTPGGLIDEARAPEVVDLYRSARDDGLPHGPGGYDTVIQVFDEGGEERFFLPQAIPIVDGGEPIGVTIVLADVTNLRKIDEMKSGLLSVVSHELKTPLTSLRMATHLLLEEHVGPLTPKQTELLLAARDDSERLHHIVANLLNMARIEAGGVQFELTPRRIESLLHDMIEPHEAAFREKGVALRIVSTDSEGVKVLADGDRLELVFANLLANALRFTPAGGEVVVSASLRQENPTKVTITIADTGVGIPAEHIGRVFDRFYRVPGQSGASGAGLGLAIAKEIVEAHHGDISVTSKIGQGTTFAFTLSTSDGAVDVQEVKS